MQRRAPPYFGDASARSRRARPAPVEVALDVTERVRERELRDRLIQQTAVSALGSLALEGRPVAELLDETARALYETLASDLILVLERTADGAPSIRASAGEDFAVSAVPSPELRRALGLLCDTGESLISSHLPSETHFRAPALEAFGILSLVAAPTGLGAAAFGAVVACSRRRDAFSTNDLAFVESIAHVLTAAIERERAVVAAVAADSMGSAFWELSRDLLAQLNDAERLAQMGSWETDFASGLHTLSESLREMLACDSSLITDERFLSRVTPGPRPDAGGRGDPPE